MQGRSGLPHVHGQLWRPLTSTQRALLTSLQSGKCAHLDMAALQPIVELGQGAVTVSTRPQDLRQQFPTMGEELVEEVVGLVSRLQVHSCTASCVPMAADLQHCRHFYPKPPSLLPLVARRPHLDTGEQEAELARLEKLHFKVQELVRGGEVDKWGEEPVTSLLLLLRELGPAPQPLPGAGFYWCGIVFVWGEELASLLEVLTPMATTREDTTLLALYHCSLILRRHPRFIPVRRVAEAWVVGYNPWALAATKANMEADLVLATLSSLNSYMSKGSGQQSLRRAAEELEERGEEQDLEMARALGEAVEAGYREVPLTEALIRLDSRLHFTSGSCGVVRVSAKLGARGEVGVSADKERYSLRPAAMEHLSLCQFLQWWYRLMLMREEQREAQAERPIPLVKSCSTPILAHHASTLPATLTLDSTAWRTASW